MTKTKKVDRCFLREYQNKIKQSFKTLFDHAKPNPKNLIFLKEPNMRALWSLDEEIVFLKSGRFPENRAFLCVGFIGRIDLC